MNLGGARSVQRLTRAEMALCVDIKYISGAATDSDVLATICIKRGRMAKVALNIIAVQCPGVAGRIIAAGFGVARHNDFVIGRIIVRRHVVLEKLVRPAGHPGAQYPRVGGKIEQPGVRCSLARTPYGTARCEQPVLVRQIFELIVRVHGPRLGARRRRGIGQAYPLTARYVEDIKFIPGIGCVTAAPDDQPVTLGVPGAAAVTAAHDPCWISQGQGVR